MGSCKALGYDIPSSMLLNYQGGSEDAILVAKEPTFILLYVTKLEEGGEVHMHYTRELAHTMTITLHYYSTEV